MLIFYYQKFLGIYHGSCVCACVSADSDLIDDFLIHSKILDGECMFSHLVCKHLAGLRRNVSLQRTCIFASARYAEVAPSGILLMLLFFGVGIQDYMGKYEPQTLSGGDSQGIFFPTENLDQDR